jgi:glutamyl-tRNA synthetase
LGIEWDEGPDVGGEFGPYRQSARRASYDAARDRLLAAGDAYYAFDTAAELDELRRRAVARSETFLYPRPSAFPTAADAEQARGQGRPVVVRFKAPAEGVTVRDRILGAVEFPPQQVDDFVIVKSDGWPTYHFAVVVDDAAMGITHVLRAQEHLMNTPKHLALQSALGYPHPTYAHLPLVFNIDGTKMSKRDRDRGLEVDVHDFRRSGYLPQALANFIALIGWSPGDDREKMTLEEMVAAFSLERINKTAGRFDREKLLAMNTDWAAGLPPAKLLPAFKDFARLNDSPMAALDDDVTLRVLDACRGFRTFRDVEAKAGILFVPDDRVVYDDAAVRKFLEDHDGRGWKTLEQLAPELEALAPWIREAIEAWLNDYCVRRGIKLGEAAQPLRVAVAGRAVSPSIGDTLALLGRTRTLNRIRGCLSRKGAEA